MCRLEAERAWGEEDQLCRVSVVPRDEPACLPGNRFTCRPGRFGQSDGDCGAISAVTQTGKAFVPVGTVLKQHPQD